MDMLRAKAKRINRQRGALLRKLKEGDQELEGEEWSLDWFKSWREKLRSDSEFSNLDEAVVKEVRFLCHISFLALLLPYKIQLACFFFG